MHLRKFHKRHTYIFVCLDLFSKMFVVCLLMGPTPPPNICPVSLSNVFFEAAYNIFKLIGLCCFHKGKCDMIGMAMHLLWTLVFDVGSCQKNLFQPHSKLNKLLLHVNSMFFVGTVHWGLINYFSFENHHWWQHTGLSIYIPQTVMI